MAEEERAKKFNYYIYISMFVVAKRFLMTQLHFFSFNSDVD